MTQTPVQTPPAKPAVSVLMYHQVGTFERPEAHRPSYCHIKRFKLQMAWLKHFGYNVISLQHAYEGLFLGAPLPRRAVVLTFDDGYRNFHEQALPVLEQHGFPATVFMISSLIGKHAEWLAVDGREPAPMMDATMLRELPQRGVEVGSHTVHHQRLSTLTNAQAKQEITDSKTCLEDLLGQEVAHFCYPFGNYTMAARDATAEAGYKTGLTCMRGAANYAANPFEIPRKGISFGDNLAGYLWKVHMKHELKEGKPPEKR